MSTAPTFDDALARVREVFAFYHTSAVNAAGSLELEDCTRDAAGAALRGRVPFAALCSELGRVAVESYPSDAIGARALGRAMTRWAAHVYERRAAS